MSLTARQRYWQAVKKARLKGARSLRQFLEGRECFAECFCDLERDALIAEIERAYQAGRNEARP